MGAPWTLTVYSFVTAGGEELPHTTASLEAARRGCLLVENTYEFVDAQPVAVFLPAGEGVAS